MDPHAESEPDGPGNAPQHGLLVSAVEALLDRTRGIAGRLSAAPEDVAHSLSSLPAPVTQLLGSVESLLEQLPQLTDEVGVVVREVHAKRLSIQAVQEELTVLDEQLALLERSLAPLEAWTRQWAQLRKRLHEGTNALLGPTPSD